MDNGVKQQLYLYEHILDALPWPISVTDTDMKLTFINQACLKTLGRKREDMLGKQCHERNGPLCRTKNCGVSLLRRGMNQALSERDGNSLQVDVSYLKDADGKNMGHLEVIQDVTAKAREEAYKNTWFERHKENLRRSAEGDMKLDLHIEPPDQYTKNANEMFVDINNDLKLVVESINALTRDADALSEAGTHGQLSTRVDVSKHKGEYRLVIEGVNKTLDAVGRHLRGYPISYYVHGQGPEDPVCQCCWGQSQEQDKERTDRTYMPQRLEVSSVRYRGMPLRHGDQGEENGHM